MPSTTSTNGLERKAAFEERHKLTAKSARLAREEFITFSSDSENEKENAETKQSKHCTKMTTKEDQQEAEEINESMKDGGSPRSSTLKSPTKGNFKPVAKLTTPFKQIPKTKNTKASIRKTPSTMSAARGTVLVTARPQYQCAEQAR